jgi:hypothetical protein
VRARQEHLFPKRLGWNAKRVLEECDKIIKISFNYLLLTSTVSYMIHDLLWHWTPFISIQVNSMTTSSVLLCITLPTSELQFMSSRCKKQTNVFLDNNPGIRKSYDRLIVKISLSTPPFTMHDLRLAAPFISIQASSPWATLGHIPWRHSFSALSHPLNQHSQRLLLTFVFSHQSISTIYI